MTWQFKRPENGRIDGKTPAEWEQAGVSRWLVSIYSGTHAVGNPKVLNCFNSNNSYAPATAEMLPALWPEVWQWRRLGAAMDDRTWGAVPRWKYGDRRVDGPRPGCICDGDRHNVAHEGEWWPPADQNGNPCAWPVEPLPVVVIPSAEMTPLVMYGHLALGGTWKWRDSENGWTAQDGGYGGAWWDQSVEDDGEQWSPCDEHGNFCEPRRVGQESGWVRVAAERVEDARRERDELAKELAEALQELSRYRGAARMAAELADEAIVWLREVDEDDG